MITSTARKSQGLPIPVPGADAAAQLAAAAIRNRAFAANQTSNITSAAVGPFNLYAIKLISVASGFFAVSFAGNLVASVAAAATITASLSAAIPTVVTDAITVANGVVAGTSVGTGSTAYTSTAIAGITYSAPGGMQAAVIQAQQIAVASATVTNLQCSLSGIVGYGNGTPITRVPLGSQVIYFLSVSPSVNAVTGNNFAFSAYELPA